MAMSLTDIEKQELIRYNIGGKNFNANAEQMKTRFDIGKKICNVSNLNGESYKFYTNPDGMVLRMLGISTSNSSLAIIIDEKIQFYTISIDELIVVEEWNNYHLELINSSEVPELFLDPLGFIVLLKLLN